MPVALVTGASRGIGRACAVRLARDGFDVVVNYAQDAASAAATAKLVEEAGRRAVLHPADVSQAAEVRALIAAAESLGPLDVLVANAGIAETKPLPDISEADWDRLVDVNLKGAFLTAQAAAGAMARRRRGSIVFLSSQAGQSGGFFVGAHYSASKGGLLALTKALAKQLASQGIRVNAVAPGIIETDMARGFPSERVAGLVAQVPLGRIGAATDVAAAVAFLVSPDAEYITGATIPVNGGLYMP